MLLLCLFYHRDHISSRRITVKAIKSQLVTVRNTHFMLDYNWGKELNEINEGEMPREQSTTTNSLTSKQNK